MTIEPETLNLLQNQDLKMIAHTLKEPLQRKKDYEVLVQPDRENFKGEVRGMTFKPGVHLITMSLKNQEPLQLCFQGRKLPLIRFIFCVQGTAKYSFDGDDLYYELNERQGATMTNSIEHEHSLTLAATEKNNLLWIDIEKETFIDQIPEQYHGQLMIEDKREDYLQVGQYNYAIANALQDIFENPYQDLVRNLYLRAKCLEIIALRLHQIQQQREKGLSLLLKEKDVEIVVEARNIQLSSLKNPPTIQELARAVGTNENTLKKNFKKVYNKTINEHLTEERLQQARLMLALKRMNVKDISVEVGYRSPSHFSRLFLKRFGMLPSQFLKNIDECNT